MGYNLAIGLICIHLIIYLMEAVTKNMTLKQVLQIANLVFLSASLILINSCFSILLLLLGVQRSKEEKHNKLPIYIAAILLSLIIVYNPTPIQEWFFLGLILFYGFKSYSDEKTLSYLKENNQQLLEQVAVLNARVNTIHKAKGQVEYITKITERNLLAQKLHDKLGHILAGNIMQLETVKIILSKDQEKGLGLIDKILENLRRGMDDIRYTLRELKPERSELGIGQVKKVLEGIGEENNAQTFLSYEGDLEAINMALWSVITENLQEALTNYMKYSDGDQFRVHIQIFNKIIKVQYADNGRPIEQYKRGLGLLGMEERVVEQGGRLILNTTDGFEILMIFNREGEG